MGVGGLHHMNFVNSNKRKFKRPTFVDIDTINVISFINICFICMFGSNSRFYSKCVLPFFVEYKLIIVELSINNYNV